MSANAMETVSLISQERSLPNIGVRARNAMTVARSPNHMGERELASRTTNAVRNQAGKSPHMRPFPGNRTRLTTSTTRYAATARRGCRPTASQQVSAARTTTRVASIGASLKEAQAIHTTAESGSRNSARRTHGHPRQPGLCHDNSLTIARLAATRRG
jgi:hypothetical protein